MGGREEGEGGRKRERERGREERADHLQVREIEIGNNG